MYEFLCTDLKESDPDFQILGEFSKGMVPVPQEGPYERHLFISKDVQAIDKAGKLGMGVLQHRGDLDKNAIEVLIASYDPPVKETHELFLFDMGNVVVKNITMLSKLSRVLGIGKEELLSDYLHYEFPLMEGVITEHTYWRHVEHRFGLSVEGNPFADVFAPQFNEPIVSLIKALREDGKRVLCASNTILSHWEILREMGALALFDNVYASHEIGLSKPSGQFYQAILDAEGFTADQAYFIDDRMDNIHSSRTLGIASFLYADLSVGKKDERLASIFTDHLPRP
ncbi:MAG: HAD-IA family hydrolase [Sphaerochaeta sp.]